MKRPLLLLCVCATLFSLPRRATAQSIPDERSRREALQYYRAGEELMSAEQFEKAATQFTKAIEKNPLFTLAHYELGQSYMALHRFASAVQAYERCLDAFRALYGFGQSHRVEIERQREDDIRELNDNMRRMLQAGQRLRATQTEVRLRELEQQRTSIDAPFHPPAEVLLALGSAFFRNGQTAEAEANWQAAVEENPKLGEAHNNLAVIYMETGRLDRAEQELKLAEKNGFRVHSQFKADLQSRRKAKS
jgi:Tfp pilus assembly protein PilF